MKYRVKYIDGVGYFPQLRKNVIHPWKNLHENLAGFVIKNASDIHDPLKDLEEANEVIRHYKALMKKENPEIKFFSNSTDNKY